MSHFITLLCLHFYGFLARNAVLASACSIGNRMRAAEEAQRSCFGKGELLIRLVNQTMIGRIFF